MPLQEKTVDIIVIGYNLPELESKCFEAVRRNTSHPYMFTFLDNFNSGLTLTEAWNKLIERSPCSYVCLLNNDTEVYPEWLEKLVDTVEKPLVGFAGPSTNRCHSPQKTIPTYEEAMRHPGEIEVMQQPISGFCVLFPKKLWRKLGGFDERYTLYGQESDFIDRAKKQYNCDCAWRKDAFVFHHGEASVKHARINVEVERSKARTIYWSTR